VTTTRTLASLSPCSDRYDAAREHPTTTVDVPVRTQSLANAREHWRARTARARRERETTRLALMGARVDPGVPPVAVQLCRLSRGLLDDDNLPTSLKSVRDEIAAYFGVGDSPRDPITWRYAQRRSSVPGVVVMLEWPGVPS
jgi:hypothetical protein